MALTYLGADVHSVVSYYTSPHTGRRLAMVVLSASGYGLVTIPVRVDRLAIEGAEVVR